MIKIKSIHERAAKSDGFRIFVEKHWPSGISKEQARIDLWMRDIAPSDMLQKWYIENPKRRQEFKNRYLNELENKFEDIDEILTRDSKGVVTLVQVSDDEKHGNGAIIREYFESRFAVRA